MTGVERPDVPDTTKESVHAPPVDSSVKDGPTVVNDSKSKRTWHTSGAKMEYGFFRELFFWGVFFFMLTT